MEATLTARGHTVDLELLYREMYGQSQVKDGERLFQGNAKDFRAVRRLLNELFGVPV